MNRAARNAYLLLQEGWQERAELNCYAYSMEKPFQCVPETPYPNGITYSRATSGDGMPQSWSNAYSFKPIT